VITNTIFHGDARNMQGIENDTVNLVVTSPPYNVGISYDGAWDDNIPIAEYEDFTHDWLAECYRVMAHSARIAINIAQLGNSPTRKKKDGYIPLQPIIVRALENNHFTLREVITWVKSFAEDPEELHRNFCGKNTAWGSWLSPSNPQCRSFSEQIIIAHKGAPALAWRGQTDLTKEEFVLWTKNVWMMPTAQHEAPNHPAPFTVELPRRVIKLYTYPGDLVLDPFMGSGSTAIAALITRRQYVGYEQSKRYTQMANNRIVNWHNTGEKVALL